MKNKIFAILMTVVFMAAMSTAALAAPIHQGQPTAYNSGASAGYYIWQEGDRWLMKTTTPGSLRNFTGTVQTNGRFENVNRLNLEDSDIVRLNEANTEISFNLNTAGDQDGLSFRLVNSADATFTLYLDGQVINPANIYIGSQNLRPTANSFNINLRPDQYTTNRVLPTYETTFSPTYITTNVPTYSLTYDPNFYPNNNAPYGTSVVPVNSYSNLSRFQGQPTAMNLANDTGYSIWQEGDRWIMRTSAPSMERNFTGTIQTNGRFENVSRLNLEDNDVVRLNETSTDISFNFQTGRDQDGLSFLMSNAMDATFALYIDGVAVNPANVYVGAQNLRPNTNPFNVNGRDDQYASNVVLPSYDRPLLSTTYPSLFSTTHPTTTPNLMIATYPAIPDSSYQVLVSALAQGQPTELDPGKVFGYFLWQDLEDRWTLQSATNDEVRQFTGIIETAGVFSDVKTLQSQLPDSSVMDVASNRIAFAFNQRDKVTGLSFRVTDGANLNFRLFADGQPIDSSKIYLGKDNRHPSGNALKIYSSNQ